MWCVCGCRIMPAALLLLLLLLLLLHCCSCCTAAALLLLLLLLPPRPSEYLELFFPVLRAQGELVSRAGLCLGGGALEGREGGW